MARLIENTNCYINPEQRNILINLFKNETIRRDFFLTGGTALSVFYLHHRVSNDLDIFTINEPKFGEIEFELKNSWKEGLVTLRMAPYILSVDIMKRKGDMQENPLQFLWRWRFFHF